MNNNLRTYFTSLSSLLYSAALIFSTGPVLGASCLDLAKKPGIDSLYMQDTREWSESGVGLFGTSVLYHFDNDILWSDARTAKNLNDAGINTLRYPGGELADNYDWESHSVERSDLWPLAATSEKDRLSRLDYREFLTQSSRIGTEEIFFVVNVDGAFRAKGDRLENIKRYAKKAAAWVAEVKRLGFNVKYWEIGNELYTRGAPITADEYSLVLNVYSKAMRAADPSILIGAAGPGGVNGSSFGDKIGVKVLDELRAGGQSAKRLCMGLKALECVKKIRGGEKDTVRVKKWWPTLLANSKDAFDFVVVHRYKMTDTRADKLFRNFKLTNKLNNLKQYIDREKDDLIFMAITEWNSPNEIRNERLTEIEHLMDIAIQLGNNAVADLQFAHYFPMRTPKNGLKALLDVEGNLTQVGRLYRELSGLFVDARVSQVMVAPGVYVLNILQPKTKSQVVVNIKYNESQLLLGHADGYSHRVTKIAADDSGGNVVSNICEVRDIEVEKAWLPLSARSITIISSVRNQ